jgi:hypothetical protein
MDFARDLPQTKEWIVWINMVRDQYAEIHNLHPRSATAKFYAMPAEKMNMLVGLFNSKTGHYEAAKQIGA